MMKSKIIESSNSISLEAEIDEFLKTITQEQLVRISHAFGLESHGWTMYTCLIIYNEI